MTVEPTRKYGLWLVSAIAIAVGAWALRHRQRPPAPAATPSVSASALRQPPPPPPIEAHLPFEFDCSAFEPPNADCATAESAAKPLLDFANQYRMGPLGCATWLDSKSSKAAHAALSAAGALDARKLSPLEKAALQNAALKVLSCAGAGNASDDARSVLKQASAVVKRFTLSAAERDALPKSDGVAAAWLHDPGQWQRGADKSFLHTRSEGFSRLHTQLELGGTVADLVRMVLLDESGQVAFTDTVQRLALRRKESDRIRVCIAELEPRCASGAALRPLPKPRQELLLASPPGVAPCNACHVNQYRPSAPFGPSTGVAPSEASQALIRAQLGLLK